MPNKSKAKAVQEPRPGVIIHDHVYFKHESGPCAGRVLSTGKHGITVYHEGSKRNVYWNDVLGHKEKFSKRMKVVDEGEDGAILEDHKGKRVFVSGGIPSETEDDMGELKKSILLLKALKNGPGLSLQETTDKAGHQVKRWKRTAEDAKDKGGFGAHDVKPGDHVGFKGGDKVHEGHVVAAGKDGATVKHAETGEHHKVFWHEIDGHNPKDEGRADAEDIVKNLFTEQETSSLSKSASQPVGRDEKDKLYKMSADASDHMTKWLKGVADDLGLDEKGGELKIAPLKGEERATEKVEADYLGDWSKLCDVVRASVIVNTLPDLKEALDHLKSKGLELAKQPKNRFANPTAEGYRDLLLNIKLPNGVIGELQLHVKPMMDAKDEGHKYYEITRTLQGRYGEDEPTDQWSDKDHKSFYEAKKAQQEIYSKAWSKAAGGGEPLTKSLASSKMIMLLRGFSNVY